MAASLSAEYSLCERGLLRLVPSGGRPYFEPFPSHISLFFLHQHDFPAVIALHPACRELIRTLRCRRDLLVQVNRLRKAVRQDWFPPVATGARILSGRRLWQDEEMNALAGWVLRIAQVLLWRGPLRHLCTSSLSPPELIARLNRPGAVAFCAPDLWASTARPHEIMQARDRLAEARCPVTMITALPLFLDMARSRGWTLCRLRPELVCLNPAAASSCQLEQSVLNP